MKNLGIVTGFAALAFGVGVVAGSLLKSGQTSHEQSASGVGPPSASLADAQSRQAPHVEPPQERAAVSSAHPPQVEVVDDAPEPTITPAQTESPPGKLFKDIAEYEASAEFNPAKRVLSPEERRRLSAELKQLEERAFASKMRFMDAADAAIERLRERGATRAVHSGNVSLVAGPLVTDVRTTQDGTTAVDLYEQDLPEAGQYRAEVEALREQGLALVRDCFQPH